MSLKDNSLATFISEMVWDDLKDRRARGVCLKCGVEEICRIDKVLNKDGHTVKQYYIRSAYRYIEGTLKGERFYDLCEECGSRLLDGEPPKKLTNRPKIEAVFQSIKKGLGHELFMLTSNSKENKDSIPSIKRRRTLLLQHKANIDERIGKGLSLDKEQKLLLTEWPQVFPQVEKQLQFAEDKETQLMKDIDAMIEESEK